MATVVVTGASGSVGVRLIPRLVEHGHKVVAVDRTPAAAGWPAGVEFVEADLRSGPARWLPADAEVVVHLATPFDGAAADTTRVVLDVVSTAPVRQFIHRSSAVVYGAWETNPVPLTENAPLRPNPGFAPAVDLAESERLVSTWASAHPDTKVAVMRPALVLAPGDDQPIVRLIGPGAHRRSEPPVVQYLGVDDFVGAIVAAIKAELDGVFNVAPAGWIDGADVIALGGTFRTPVPDVLRDAVRRFLWTVRLSRRPPSADPWLRHPWVVAPDRLQAAGWRAESTSEEAVVATRRGSWWRELSPNRRQEVTLAAAGGTLAVVVGSVVAAVRRVGRR